MGRADAEAPEPYRYDLQTSASDFARQFFGDVRYPHRSNNLDMGNVGIGVSTELDCGEPKCAK